ncbi:hypothetical protein ACP4OV_008882 [Aristida adscensionis]
MAGGEEYPMEHGTVLTLDGQLGLPCPCSTKGKAAEEETAAAGAGQAGSVKASKAATAAGQVGSVKASKAAEAAEVQPEGDSSQDKGVAVDDDEEGADGADDDEAPTMTALDYIIKYKQLPQYEVDLILEKPVERTPFTDTQEFKDLSADPDVTPEDIADAAAEHDDRQDERRRFQECVRSEYETHGYVLVSEEYIARRIHIDEYCEKRWKEMFADIDDDEDDEDTVGEEQEAMEAAQG